jgi:hypothetical protein
MISRAVTSSLPTRPWTGTGETLTRTSDDRTKPRGKIWLVNGMVAISISEISKTKGRIKQV